jgi:spoIIIJ-associated protein
MRATEGFMTSKHEFEGKTKEEAVRKASEKLGLPEDQLDFEVLSYGSTGIFGLVGVKKAKIQVRVPASYEPEASAVETPESPEHTEEVTTIAKNALEKMVAFIVEDATVTVEDTSDIVKFKVEGSNSALLIGKHGRTLDALQYIVQKIVQKEKRTKKRIVVDVEGYRERRKASLTQLALRLGEKVKRSGKPATISPMNAYDRRIVHMALKDDDALRTQSRGGGLFRKLVILPDKKRKKASQQANQPSD